jgi:outer membrane protein assembly factor BamA
LKTALFYPLFIIACLLVVFGSNPEWASAQMSAPSGGGSYEMSDSTKKVQFAAVPVPSYNRSIGLGLGAMVAGYYKLNRHDTLTPPSTTGLFGFYAENGTWMGGVFQTLNFDEDKYRLTFAGGYANVNFQFYTGDLVPPPYANQFVDYNQTDWFAVARGQRRVWKRLFLGLDYQYRQNGTVLADTLQGPGGDFSGLGVLASYDRRDNIFNAYSGWLADLETLFFFEAIGSDRDFNKYQLEGDAYFTLNSDTTQFIAAQALAQIATGDVPFSEQYIIGVRNLRGYSDGKHRADQVYTAQAEFRWRFWRRLGMVAFGGFGWSVDTISEISLDGILPSIGVGGRFMAIKDYRINVRVDVAKGKDDWGLYFAIGEAF